MNKNNHISEEDIFMYFAEKLSPSEKNCFKNHIIKCRACAIVYMEWEEVLNEFIFILLNQIKNYFFSSQKSNIKKEIIDKSP